MSIQKRTRNGSTTWRARYRDDDGGQRSRVFGTQREAKAWELARVTARVEGTESGFLASESTFRQLARDWLLSDPNKARTTLARDRNVLGKWFVPVLGDLELRCIHPGHVQRAVGAMVGKLAPKTVHTNAGVLRACLGWALESDLIERTPYRGVKLPPIRKVRKPVAGVDDVDRLAAEVPADYRVAIYLGAQGLRFAEVAGLRVGSIDFPRGLLTVEATINEVDGAFVEGAGKTEASGRTISIPQFLVHLLVEHVARTGRRDADDLVVQAPEGGPLRPGNFRMRVYNPAVARAGLPAKLTFHRLRHSSGDHLREMGVELEVIQKRLGHASIRTTADVYGTLPVNRDRAVADQLDQMYRVNRGSTGEMTGT